MADPMPPPSDYRALSAALSSMDARLAELERATGTQRALTTRRQPVVTKVLGRTTGFGLTGSWATYATASLTVPEGKTYATITATGLAAALDMTSGGLTSSNARIVINGNVGGTYAAAKDVGANTTNNVLIAAHALAFNVAPGDVIQVQLQLQALNPSAFPSNQNNYATIVADAAFTG